jgi:hypothetical protein
MTSFLNFFDPDRDGIVNLNSWGTLQVNFGAGGGQDQPGLTGPAGQQGLQEPQGPTGQQDPNRE